MDSICRGSSDLVLHSEHVSEPPVIPFGPYMTTRFGINKSRTDTQALAATAHAAFQHVARSQFFGHQLHRNWLTLACETGISSDHNEPASARKLRDYIFCNAIREK